MPQIDLRWSFLISFCLLVILAFGLSHALPERPLVLTPFSKISSVGDVGHEIAQEIGRLIERANSNAVPKFKLVGIGYPKIDTTNEAIIDLAVVNLPLQARLIVGGNIKIHRPHETVDLLEPSAMNDLLSKNRGRTLTIVILPTIFISHRMGRNWVTEFERRSGESISSYLLSELAMSAQAEERLSPKCYTSQRTPTTETYDVGCIILKVSRDAQNANLDPKLNWMQIEKELPNETLVSFHMVGGSTNEH